MQIKQPDATQSRVADSPLVTLTWCPYLLRATIN